jgi:hypothetical protein
MFLLSKLNPAPPPPFHHHQLLVLDHKPKFGCNSITCIRISDDNTARKMFFVSIIYYSIPNPSHTKYLSIYHYICSFLFSFSFPVSSCHPWDSFLLPLGLCWSYLLTRICLPHSVRKQPHNTEHHSHYHIKLCLYLEQVIQFESLSL